MTNIDKIRQMSARDLAEFLTRDRCKSCNLQGDCMSGTNCIENIELWLGRKTDEQEDVSVKNTKRNEP